MQAPERASGQPFRYTGQRYDAETGLYYYRARYYDAVHGRFLQTDPILYEDQINLYAYVGNDPINATDPSGMQKKQPPKKKPVVSGKPQKKNGANGQAHAAGSVSLTQQTASKSTEPVQRRHYNQSFKTVTGDPTAPGIRPDGAVVTSKSVTPIEKVSPTQTIQSQAEKWKSQAGRTNTDSATGAARIVRPPVVAKAVGPLQVLTVPTGMMSGRIDFDRGVVGAVADAFGLGWQVPNCSECTAFAGVHQDGRLIYYGPDGYYDFDGNKTSDYLF